MDNNEETILEIIDNFSLIIQMISEYSKAAEKATNLTRSQIRALKIISGSVFLRLSDLAYEMQLSPATVVGIVDRLEEKGFVVRTRSRMDRRTVELFLTDRGMGIISETNEDIQTLLANGLNKLSNEQFTCVEAGMKQIVQILGVPQTLPHYRHEV